LSPIVGSLPKVEILVHRPKIEQICSMSHLKQITVEGAEILDEYFLGKNVSIEPRLFDGAHHYIVKNE